MAGFYRAGNTGDNYFDEGAIPLSAITYISGNYQVLESDRYIINEGTDITLTLEASPVAGRLVYIKDFADTKITIDGNGNDIDYSSSYLLRKGFATVTLLFSNGSWKVY